MIFVGRFRPFIGHKGP